jgi:hypothetical protein
MAATSTSTSAGPDPARPGAGRPVPGAEPGVGAPAPDPLERAVAAIERHAVLVLCALLAVSGALLMYMGRGLTFFYDEWEWILNDYGGGVHWMLLAHVGNISFWPAAIYKVWFHLIGLNHYAVFRLQVVVLHLICGTLVYVMAARRIPRLPALLAATLILFLGAAWEDLLWGFQVGYLLSVSGGLAALVLLEGKPRPGRDLAAMSCLVISAGSSSLGVPIMVGVAVELVRTQAGRRRLWVVLVPAALYALWYLTHGTNQVTEESLIKAPGFAEDLAAAAFGGLVGRGLEWGRPLAVAGVLVLLYGLVRRPPLTPRLGGLLAAAIGLWAVIAAARSTISIPEESRYIYLGAVLIVLVGVELLRGVTIPPRASALATVIVAGCVLTGLTLLHIGATRLRPVSKTVTAELGALEVAAAYAPPEYRPDPMHAPPVFAGLYLHTVHSIGSTPADTPAQILASEAPARAAAEAVVLALETPRLRPLASLPLAPAPAPAPALASVERAVRAPRAGCVHLTPQPGGPMNATLILPASGVAIRDEGPAPTSFALKRFGEAFVSPPIHIAPRSAGVLSMPVDPDDARVPWQLQVVSRSPLTLCGVSA